MAKKNNDKKNDKKIFTEEDLLTDDGTLEIGFGGNEEEKDEKKKMGPGKQKPVAKKSEVDRRVAAIIKKLKDESPDYEEEEDDVVIAEDDFNELLSEVTKSIEETIDTVSSTRECERLKKKFGVGGYNNHDKLRALAAQRTSSMVWDIRFNDDKIERLKEELREASPVDRGPIKRKIKKLEKENARMLQIIDASNALTELDYAKQEAQRANSGSVTEDIRELYQKYGEDAIRKLLTYNDEEMFA